MPCLIALFGAFAPRVTVLFLWLFTPLVGRAFSFWLWPLLGVIILPYTTLFYALVVGQLGTDLSWGWLAVLLGLLLDLRSFADSYMHRSRIPGLPQYGTNPNRIM